MSFGWQSIQHAFADVAKEAVTIAKVLGKIDVAAAPIVEGVTAVVFPPAVTLERAAFSALGLVVNAANDVGGAASSEGLNLQLDAQTVADFKALFAGLEAMVKSKGVDPASLPKK